MMRPSTLRLRALLIAGLMLLPLTSGCDTFLEPDPASFSTTANFYENPAQFERAVVGAYTRLRTFVGDDSYKYMADLRGPTLTRHFDVNLPHTVAGTPQLDEFTMTIDNGQSRSAWINLFALVKETNVILGRIDGVEFPDAALQERLIGEVKFMRAFAYWAGAQFWGDLPILLEEVTSPENAVPEGGRRPVQEVYQQVIADLQDAISKLPTSASEPGRITQGAARMLLGRTYLLTGDYADALSQFQALDNGQYVLLQNYRDVFDPANRNNAESILEIQYNPTIPGQPTNNTLFVDIIPFNSGSELGPPSLTPAGRYLPTPDIINSYEASDNRKDQSIAWWVKEGNSEFVEIAFGDSLPILNKFYFPEFADNTTGYNANWIVFRFADALLSAAEAEWRLGNDGSAMNYIDRVRDRAGLDGLNLADYSGELTGSPLGDALLHERSVELLGEGHNWLDLLRFGTDVTMKVMIAHGEAFRERDPKTADVYVIEEYKLLYPIDPRELVLGNLTQNPGWR